MNRLQRSAVLTELCDGMTKKGSWCGETHLQKAVYFLQDLLSVPLDFDFILYKHGPFSFELRDELSTLRANGLLEVSLQPFPYGPSFLSTKASDEFRKGFPHTLGKYEDEINFVANALGGRTAGNLERLATVLYIRSEEREEDPEAIARRLHELKSHVSPDGARAAVEEFQELVQDAPL